VADDDESLLVARRIMEFHDIEVETLNRPDQIFRTFDVTEFDVIVLDIMMAPVNGIRVAEEIRRRHAEAPPALMFLSAKRILDTERERIRAVGARVVHKPFHPADLVQAAREMVAARA
jgi:two-component system aerobic respiration control sensor histidine kinase ArcB